MQTEELACSRLRVAHNVRVVKRVRMGLRLLVRALVVGEGFAIQDFIATINATFDERNSAVQHRARATTDSGGSGGRGIGHRTDLERGRIRGELQRRWLAGVRANWKSRARLDHPRSRRRRRGSVPAPEGEYGRSRNSDDFSNFGKRPKTSAHGSTLRRGGLHRSS